MSVMQVLKSVLTVRLFGALARKNSPQWISRVDILNHCDDISLLIPQTRTKPFNPK
jgi:hypothetical protein